MAKKKPFPQTLPYALLCGSIIFLAIAVLLSSRARHLEQDFLANAPGPEASEEEAPAAPETIEGLIPGPDVMAAWKQEGDLEKYDPDTLFDLINGGSEVYIENGFKEVLAAWYTDLSGGANNLTIFIFDMVDPKNAEKMYRIENPDSPPGAGLDEGGCRAQQSTIFWKGPYYIKVETEDLTGKSKETLEPVARALEGRLRAFD